MALAALGAVFNGTSEQGTKAGLTSLVAERFMLPLGVIPRLRLLACGWRNPGDKFKRADDAAWWKTPHISGTNFWATFGTYVDKLEQTNVGGNWNFDQRIVDGDAAAISTEIAAAQDDLEHIQAAKADVCLPYFTVTKRGALPDPNLVCLAKIGAPKIIEPLKPALDELITLFGISLPWWAWVGLGFLVAKKLK